MSDELYIVILTVYFLAVSFAVESIEKMGGKGYFVAGLFVSMGAFIYAGNVAPPMVYFSAVVIHIGVYVVIKTALFYHRRNRKRKEIPAVPLEELSPFISDIESKIASGDERVWELLSKRTAEYIDEYFGMGDGAVIAKSQELFKRQITANATRDLSTKNEEDKKLLARSITLAMKQNFPGLLQYCYHQEKKEKQ